MEECEAVVQYAYAITKQSNVCIEDLGLDSSSAPPFTQFKCRHFSQRVRLARSYYPHTYNMDGFFVCRLKKVGNLCAEDLDNKDMSKEDETIGVGTGLAESSLEEATDTGDWNEEKDELYLACTTEETKGEKTKPKS